MSDLGSKLRINARRLRRDQTDAERKLWMHLRARQVNGLKFRRQHPLGPYIVDFICPEHNLVIELDGGHHTEQAHRDERRTRFLTHLEYQVIRFWDHEVLTAPAAVVQQITNSVHAPSPPPSPPKRGRGISSRAKK